MLTHLAIRNLAVVDAAELDMEPGFTALTGETGAGKSILVGALSLATGERADSNQVRTGENQADISACFEIPPGTPLPAWADDYELGGECILRRVIRADGRSRGSINGVPAPARKLRELGACLVDICGQKAHQALLHTGAQLRILDEFGGLSEAVAKFSACHAALREAERECGELQQRAGERAARLELLESWISELEALNPQSGELEELDRIRLRLANRARLIEAAGSALAALDESEHSVGGALASARQTLDGAGDLDPALKAPARLLVESEVLVAEAVASIRDFGLDLEEAEGNLDEVQQRRQALLAVARKHGRGEEELPGLAAELTAEKRGLASQDEQLSLALERRDRLWKEVEDGASHLSGAREQAALEFAREVSDRMQGLAMEGGSLCVEFSRSATPGRRGSDQVEFQVALNPGQAARPLARCASGGELARIGLAIQLAAVGARQPPTMIFDEVDSGIGGRVAEVVGAGLKELGHRGQVLSVTHLAQVASQADQQILVSKVVRGEETRTVSAQLQDSERIREVARMLGGVEITPRTLAHAEEMLARGRVRPAHNAGLLAESGAGGK